MSEPTMPTHMLLRQLKNTDGTACDDAFNTLVYRFRGPFERYAREKLGNEDAVSATDDTFLKIYRSRMAYEEKKCGCKEECRCIEHRAHKYLWTIHEHTVTDQLRQRQRKKHLSIAPEEILDETWLAPESSNISPEAYVEARITQEIILCTWNTLSEADQQLLMHQQGPGRPNAVRQRARCKAWRRFRMALAAALAEEE